MRDETAEREREEEERRKKAERTKEMHELEAEVNILRDAERSKEREIRDAEEEIRRLETEKTHEERTLDDEIRRRKTIIERLVINLEKKKSEHSRFKQDLAQIEQDMKRAESKRRGL